MTRLRRVTVMIRELKQQHHHHHLIIISSSHALYYTD